VQITRATDYATRVMIFLASLPPAAKAQSAAIARATEVPTSFLSKVMQRLVSAGLVASSRGSGGGFGLAVARGRITMLDILETFEGETRLNLCLTHGPSCNRKSRCPAHAVWEEAQRALVAVLRQASLEKLVQGALSRVCHSERSEESALVRRTGTADPSGSLP